MTGGLDKVNARVNTVIHELVPVQPVLLFKIRIETGFNVVHDRFPTIKVTC